jgi:PRTRC genetic system ThiF family protein
MTSHFLLPRLVTAHGPLRVVVVGVGGTGASVLGGLPALDQSLRAFGHPGLQVTVFDPDRVSEANCARQPFARCEIGSPKASLLVSRINAFYGYSWDARVEAVTPDTQTLGAADLVIGCVDTRAARLAIKTAMTRGYQDAYWLDYGNNAGAGQFVLGSVKGSLPTVDQLYPEMIDPRLDDPSIPSCTARESLLNQGAFVNQTLAQMGLAMLARLFKEGQLCFHGAFVNFATGQAAPIAVPVPVVKAKRVKKPVATTAKRARRTA